MSDYKPCEFTIKCTRLNISPLHFNKKISKSNVKKILKIDDNFYKEITKLLRIDHIEEFITTKEFITLIDYLIRTEKISYNPSSIKNRYFITQKTL